MADALSVAMQRLIQTITTLREVVRGSSNSEEIERLMIQVFSQIGECGSGEENALVRMVDPKITASLARCVQKDAMSLDPRERKFLQGISIMFSGLSQAVNAAKVAFLMPNTVPAQHF